MVLFFLMVLFLILCHHFNLLSIEQPIIFIKMEIQYYSPFHNQQRLLLRNIINTKIILITRNLYIILPQHLPLFSMFLLQQLHWPPCSFSRCLSPPETFHCCSFACTCLLQIHPCLSPSWFSGLSLDVTISPDPWLLYLK